MVRPSPSKAANIAYSAIYIHHRTLTQHSRTTTPCKEVLSPDELHRESFLPRHTPLLFPITVHSHLAQASSPSQSQSSSPLLSSLSLSHLSRPSTFPLRHSSRTLPQHSVLRTFSFVSRLHSIDLLSLAMTRNGSARVQGRHSSSSLLGAPQRRQVRSSSGIGFLGQRGKEEELKGGVWGRGW